VPKRDIFRDFHAFRNRESPQMDPGASLCAKHREGKPMAAVTLTARYLDLLKPQRKRSEVFDIKLVGRL
jgi:hypothetical protein